MAVLAPALVTLRSQIDLIYPFRDRTSDGWIGDSAHSSRTSDHNPNAAGVVCAIDVDEDLAPGVDLWGLRAALLKHRDSRLNYTIYERKINGRVEFLDRYYGGSNGHHYHMHISVRQDATYYNDARAWDLSGFAPTVKPITTPIQVIQNPKHPGIQSAKNFPNGSTKFPTDYEALLIDGKAPAGGLTWGAFQILMHAIEPIGRKNNQRWDGKLERLSVMDAQEWLARMGYYDVTDRSVRGTRAGIRLAIDGVDGYWFWYGLQRFLRDRGFYNKTDNGVTLVLDGKPGGWTIKGLQRYLNTQNGR